MSFCTRIQQRSAENATITRDVIREQAKVFDQKMNITDFEYSSGWLNRFKKLWQLSQNMQSGKTADVDQNVDENGHKNLSALISEYKAKDVYNMDEYGPFYHL